MQRLPEVDAVRPTSCPCCSRSSQLPGRPLVIHGHGLRTRDLLGPLDDDEVTGVHSITLRRYRCTACRAVLTVMPRGMAPGYRYSLAAIALALAAWLESSAHRVRSRVSPLSVVDDCKRWSSLGRWARQWRNLWPALQLAGDGPARQLAARIVFALRGHPGQVGLATASAVAARG